MNTLTEEGIMFQGSMKRKLIEIKAIREIITLILFSFLSLNQITK